MIGRILRFSGRTRCLWMGILFFAFPLFTFGQSWGDLLEKTKSQAWWEPYRDVLLIVNDRHIVSIDPQLQTIVVDGKRKPSVEGIQISNKIVSINSAAFNTLVALLNDDRTEIKPSVSPLTTPIPASSPSADSRFQSVKVIVLDAGHGGQDPGSIAKHVINGKEFTLQEKDLTLAVTLQLAQLLKAKYPEKSIVLTREDDSYPTLEERVKIAHKQPLGDKDSILFLSLHFNASINKNAKGLEFWYVPQDYEREVLSDKEIPDTAFPVLNALVDAEFKKESRQLSVILAESLGKELGQENVQRGLKENPWFVVRMAKMPAVLVELGFITNPEEANDLRDPDYLKKLARGLYTGLVQFIRNYEDHS